MRFAKVQELIKSPGNRAVESANREFLRTFGYLFAEVVEKSYDMSRY